jgi:tetratricopeptide (TPR) repeat protein
MRNKTAVRRLSLAVIAALPAVILPGVSQAQFRANNQDGRALDANNRVGSGGYNEGRDIVQPSGNQIVTGNVTAGREFRGPVPYSDPNVFAGPSGTDSTDRFIRGSSGAPEYSTQVDMTQPRPFYGNRTITPPPGYVQTTNGTYAPAPLVTDTTAGQPPVGTVNNPTMSGPPMPGEMILPGPGTDANSILTASPLYGIRQWDVNNPNDAYFLNNYTSMGGQGRGPLDAQTLERYRQELRNSGNQPPTDGNANPNQLNNPAMNLPQTPENQALDSSVNRGQVGGDQGLAGNVGTDQSLRNRLLTPPTQQSQQFAEMHNRYDRFKDEKAKTDAEYNREYQAQLRQKKAQEEANANSAGKQNQQNQPNQPILPNQPAQPGQSGQPGQVATPGQPASPQQPAAPQDNAENKESQEANANKGQPEKPEPIKVDTLANGVQAKGLADVLRKAEELMKDGKFASALDQYDIAQQIAPNNPLIVLGRAHAELGAGYYARAEAHIREAVTKDPAVLVGQYDLRVFIGNDRLQEVVKELKNISVNEPNQTTPVFLLAYIAYNTGNERQAAAWLDLAEKRAGKTDGVYRAMRELWKLPTAQSQPAEQQPGEMNK